MNYSHDEWAEIKTTRRHAQAQKRYDNDPEYRLHLLLHTLVHDKTLQIALEALRALVPKHPMLRYPTPRTKRIDSYARKRVITSPKNNPELVKDSKAITRTLLIFKDLDSFTGMDLSRDMCETLDLVKVWSPYQTELRQEWVIRLADHVETIIRTWREAEKQIGAFLRLTMGDEGAKRIAAKPDRELREKREPKYDAHYRAMSLDVLTGWEVI